MTPSLFNDVLVITKHQVFPVILAIFVTVLVSACQPAADPAAEEADRRAAEAKLDRMLAEKQERAQAEQQRREIADQREAERQAAAEAEANRPHYGAVRLQHAARPRTWASITVPDINVKAVFNSSWSNDRLNYRVALLGHRAAIDTFLSSYHQVQINFADQGGTKIFEFPISATDFVWAEPSFNGGIPTVQTTGRVPCDLPVYEQTVQWNLTWQ